MGLQRREVSRSAGRGLRRQRNGRERQEQRQRWARHLTSILSAIPILCRSRRFGPIPPAIFFSLFVLLQSAAACETDEQSSGRARGQAAPRSSLRADDEPPVGVPALLEP